MHWPKMHLILTNLKEEIGWQLKRNEQTKKIGAAKLKNIPQLI